MHWASSYIGLPYSDTGNGPDSFHCWSFFRHVQKEHFGIEISEIPGDGDVLLLARTVRDHVERKRWDLVETPKEGDCALLRQARYPIHVGMWLDVDGMGGILHCVRGPGVVFQRVDELKRSGWFIEGYYRFNGAPL